MNITNLFLHKFKKFEYSRITSFEAEINKPIQIIVGTNGSGKSSLLNELFPFPSVKSSFAKDGIKTLGLEHEGDKYELTYTTTNGHAFLKNGVNKNTNGSFNLQKELVRSYFGIDQNIQNILRCEYSFTKLTPSQRKLLLNTINPVDVSYLTEASKRIHKRVVFYKNNLSMLNQRKEELLEKKMATKEYEQMITTKATLEEQEKLLLVWDSKVTDLLTSVRSISCSTNLRSLTVMTEAVVKSLVGYECFTFDKTTELLTKKKQVAKSSTAAMKKLEDALSKLVDTINELSTDIQLYKDSTSSTDEDLRAAIEEVEAYRQDDSTILIPESDIDSIEAAIPFINDLLTDISHVQLPEIYSISKVVSIKDNIADTKRSLLEANTLKSSLQTELQQLTGLMKNYSIPSNCPNNCQLKDAYTASKSSSDSKAASLNTKLEDTKKLIDTGSSKLAELEAEVNAQREAWVHVTKLQRVWTSNPYLQKIVDIDRLTDMINESPYSPVSAIVRTVKNSRVYINHLSSCAKLNDLKKASDVRSKISNMNLTNMTKILNLKEDEHTKLTDELNKLKQFLTVNEADMAFLSRHKESLDELRRIGSLAENHLEYAVTKYDREYLTKLASILSNLLSSTRSNMISVIQIVDEQKSIHDRLEHEIEEPINSIQKQLGKVVLVEKALIDLQNLYSVSFIDSLTKLANGFLEDLMSYSLKIKTTDGKPTFKFPFIIDDHIDLDDIAMGSTAQRSMIDLSFNLALIIRLKLTNYPMSLDEVDSPLDPIHKRKLLELMNSLITDNIVSQLFLVNHDTAFHNALDGSYIVLNDDNIESIPNANEFVTIE